MCKLNHAISSLRQFRPIHTLDVKIPSSRLSQGWVCFCTAAYFHRCHLRLFSGGRHVSMITALSITVTPHPLTQRMRKQHQKKKKKKRDLYRSGLVAWHYERCFVSLEFTAWFKDSVSLLKVHSEVHKKWFKNLK